jgi:hypothetical protein
MVLTRRSFEPTMWLDCQQSPSLSSCEDEGANSSLASYSQASSAYSFIPEHSQSGQSSDRSMSKLIHTHSQLQPYQSSNTAVLNLYTLEHRQSLLSTNRANPQTCRPPTPTRSTSIIPEFISSQPSNPCNSRCLQIAPYHLPIFSSTATPHICSHRSKGDDQVHRRRNMAPGTQYKEKTTQNPKSKMLRQC